MLRTWIETYDEINASPKGSQKNRRETAAKEPEMEQQLHKLFVQKRSIGRKISSKWFQRNARIIYSNIYPHRVVRTEGKQTSYTGFAFSRGWFTGFLRRNGISLRVCIFFLILFIFVYKSNSFIRLLLRKHKLFLLITTKNARIGCSLISRCKSAKALHFQRLLTWIKHQYLSSSLDQRHTHQKAQKLCGLSLHEVDRIKGMLHFNCVTC